MTCQVGFAEGSPAVGPRRAARLLASRGMATRLVTWNLQGNAGLQVKAVADVVRELAADVLCLQEVQWAQYRALRHELVYEFGHWSFKHWPLRRPPEGHAVLSGAALRVEARTISRRVPPWHWERRIAQIGRVESLSGLVLVNTHLGSGRPAVERAEQIARVLGRARADIVVGDLNEASGAAIDALGGAGLRDAWAEAHGGAECATNWSQSDRSLPPDQRLDWVWVSPAVRVLDAQLGDWRVTAPLSDHVPLAVTLEAATGAAT